MLRNHRGHGDKLAVGDKAVGVVFYQDHILSGDNLADSFPAHRRHGDPGRVGTGRHQVDSLYVVELPLLFQCLRQHSLAVAFDRDQLDAQLLCQGDEVGICVSVGGHLVPGPEQGQKGDGQRVLCPGSQNNIFHGGGDLEPSQFCATCLWRTVPKVKLNSNSLSGLGPCRIARAVSATTELN